VRVPHTHVFNNPLDKPHMLISHNLYLQQYINTSNGWNYELLMRASFYEREVYEMQATHGFTKRNQTRTQHHLSIFKLSWSKHNSNMANTIIVAPNLLNIGVWDSGLYCHLCLFPKHQSFGSLLGFVSDSWNLASSVVNFHVLSHIFHLPLI